MSSSLILPPAAAAAAQKKKLEAEQHPRRCGNCFYGETDATTPPNMVRCEGLPPTGLVLGATQTPMGVEPNIVLWRPNLPQALRGCALWSQKSLPGVPDGAPETRQ